MLEQKWYTVADVAELTGLTDRTIRNYLKSGSLHGRKIGVQWRFTEDDINGLFSEVSGQENLSQVKDNLVADFLKETKREQETECRIIDIPCVAQNVLPKLIRHLTKKKQETGQVSFAWEYHEAEGLLRIVLVGTQTLLAGMSDEIKKDLGACDEGYGTRDSGALH